MSAASSSASEFTSASASSLPSMSATVPLELDGGALPDGGDAGVTSDASPDASAAFDAAPVSPPDAAPDAAEAPLDAAATDAGSASWSTLVTCSWATATAATDRVGVNLTLQNIAQVSLDVTGVTIYYYFSADGREATLSQELYFSDVDEAALHVVATPGLGSGADHALVVDFAGCDTGCALASNASRNVNFAIVASSNGQQFNATNDYSYAGGVSPCEHIVVKQGTAVLFGTAP